MNPILERHEPQRTCCVCGAKKSKAELLRVASRDGAAPHVDEKGKEPGRGAWLCVNRACVEKALARRAFERHLKLKVALDDEFKRAVRAAIENRLAQINESDASKTEKL